MSVSHRLKIVANRVLQGESLRAKAARGGAWLGSGSFAEQVSRFARNMLLTRLLAPSAFGAMAIVLSSSSLVSSFSDVGLWPAVIRNPRGGDDAYLNAAWWLGIGRAIGIYALIFAAAPLVSRFYGMPDLSMLLRVALLSIVLDGMISPRSKLAQKEMKFGKWAFISNGGGICGVVLTVILSFVLRDVRALAIGYCCENAFRCLFSYILFPGLPSLKWDSHAIGDLLTFSKGMLGLSFLNLIFARADIFVLGKLYSPEALGIYTMAVYLVQTPSSFLINILGVTLLPAFSHVREDTERGNRILSEVTSWIILLGLPAVVMIWQCGSSLLTVTYGARYAAAAGALAVAAGVALLNTLNSLVTNLFYAAGRPALHRRAVGASAVVMMIAIYPACKYMGSVGGQFAALLAISASYALQIVRARSITGLSVLQYGRAVVPAMLVTAVILIVGVGERFLGLATRPLANIAVAAAACLVAYALSVPAFMRIREIA
ncbi:MAG TPA: oligosaccharide flippase family protein [Acidobacteriaceae bacterium]